MWATGPSKIWHVEAFEPANNDNDNDDISIAPYFRNLRSACLEMNGKSMGHPPYPGSPGRTAIKTVRIVYVCLFVVV